MKQRCMIVQSTRAERFMNVYGFRGRSRGNMLWKRLNPIRERKTQEDFREAFFARLCYHCYRFFLQVAEEQELPLREWVQHVEGQVNAARNENARLSAALSSTLAFRASLLSDDSEAQPLRDAGMNVQQVQWLRDHERSCLTRKAQLKEEIAAEEKRRDEFLKEAWQHRAIAEERHRRLGVPGNLPNILQTPSQVLRRPPGSAISASGSVLGSPKFPYSTHPI